MSERLLEVGEIGVLQNINICCDGKDRSYVNGRIATVLSLTPEGYFVNTHGFHFPPPYDTGKEGILRSQIRRISNPDAEQSTEQEKVVVV